MTAEDPNSYWMNHPPEWPDPEEDDDFDCGQCAYFKRKRYRGRYIHICEVHHWETTNAFYCPDFEPKE
jgi:hypothetical protein